MSEPLKPRIDFAEPLKEESTSAFKAQQTFSEAESRTFAPAAIDEPRKTKARQKRRSMPRCAPNAAYGVKW